MLKNIAHLDISNVLQTVAKFFRVMDKVDISLKDFILPMQNIEKRKNLAKYLKSNCPKVNEEGIMSQIISEYDIVKHLLGDNFITPSDIATVSDIIYSDIQLKALDKNFPSIAIIDWCRENGFILLPNPPESMSLMDINKFDEDLFIKKEYDLNLNESFVEREGTGVGTWLAIRNGAIKGSYNKSWEEQLTLLDSQIEIIPNTVELSWASMIYESVRGLEIFSNTSIRTNDINSKGYRVVFGHFEAGQAFSAYYKEDDARRNFGITSVRIF